MKYDLSESKVKAASSLIPPTIFHVGVKWLSGPLTYLAGFHFAFCQLLFSDLLKPGSFYQICDICSRMLTFRTCDIISRIIKATFQVSVSLQSRESNAHLN
jgi:hypothetical protein